MFSVPSVLAQEEEAPAVQPPEVFVPDLENTPEELRNQRPQVTDFSSIEDPELSEAKEEEGFIQGMMDVPVVKEGVHSNHNVGLGFAYSNHALSKAMFKVSDDDVLLGNAGEKSFALFVLLDMGWRQDSSEAFRLRWGLGRSTLSIPESIRDANPADSLEQMLTLMSFDWNLKQEIPSMSDSNMFFWWGMGLSYRYILASSTSGAGSNRVSQLRHSSALAPLVSVGMDMKSEGSHQIFFQGDWILLKGVQFSVGISTYL